MGTNNKTNLESTKIDNTNFKNRELSWLSFNRRCLSEAQDESLLLFERLKFLSITASNLDEFFMVRVASLKDQVNANYKKPDISGMTAKEQIDEIFIESHDFIYSQYETLNLSFMPELKRAGVNIIEGFVELNSEQKAYVNDYFLSNIFPVLTPIVVDSSRAFPLIRNKSLNIGVLISEKNNPNQIEFATVQVPSLLPRIIKIPSTNKEQITIIFIEEIIQANLSKLFTKHDIICSAPYSIIRNAGLSIDEDDAADLLIEIEKQLKMRQWGEPIRLDVHSDIDKRLLKVLKKKLKIKKKAIFMIPGPLDLTFLMNIYKLSDFDKYKDLPFKPAKPHMISPNENLFAQIRKKDILMHHPYESFEPVVNFIKTAAKDPNVLAIKQTLYRVSKKSPIIAALKQAAENGKQVTVLVELKARFDEQNNIEWAKTLEKSGCHVIYGVLGLKTHSKITLVIRNEEDGIKSYVHLGTGNYNDSTARLYTDLGLFTCKKEYGADAVAFFNMLSGYSVPESWNKLIVAPKWLRDKFLYLINRESQNAKKGLPAKIIAKMNSLCDQEVINALYEASQAGVEIQLIIRGICCLKAGIPDLSENIHVRSIVGTFLEHARIYYFENNNNSEIYLASADWMPRNLDKRIEIMFPIEEETLKKEIMDILDIQLSDTRKAHILMPNGFYKKLSDELQDTDTIDSQKYLCKRYNDLAGN